MKKYVKAILACVIAAGGSLATALGDNVISSQEWVTAAIVAATALGVVYQIPNKPPA